MAKRFDRRFESSLQVWLEDIYTYAHARYNEGQINPSISLFGEAKSGNAIINFVLYFIVVMLFQSFSSILCF